MPQRHHLPIEGVERVERFLDLEDLLGPDRRLRGRCQPPQQHRGQGRRAGLGQRIAIERDLPAGVPHLRAQVLAMDHRQPIADDQSQPEKHRQLGVAQIALHPLRQVEEAVLKHVGGVDPTLKPRVHAQLDHPPQPVAVPLEQVGERPAIPGSEPLDQADGLARWIFYDVAHTLYWRTGAGSGQEKWGSPRILSQISAFRIADFHNLSNWLQQLRLPSDGSWPGEDVGRRRGCLDDRDAYPVEIEVI